MSDNMHYVCEKSRFLSPKYNMMWFEHRNLMEKRVNFDVIFQ